MTKLLYRVVPHNGGVVFAEEDRAREIASIHNAIANSTTWGEFKAAMPPKEYEWIFEWYMEGIDYDEDLGEEPQPPTPEEPFDGYFLICEGDYPAWLQAEMGRVIPRDLLHRYGKSEQTFINGDFWNIPKTNIEPIVAELRARGFEVEEAQDLKFH